MNRSLLAAIVAIQLAAAQQPQPQVPQAPGQQPPPTTRQTVEAPPPPLARQRGSEPAQGTAPAVPGLGTNQPLLPLNTQIAPAPPDRNALVRPYSPVGVPPIRTEHTPRIATLVRGGALYLTLQDAIAPALENNIDAEVSRYGSTLATWQLTR